MILDEGLATRVPPPLTEGRPGGLDRCLTEMPTA